MEPLRKENLQILIVDDDHKILDALKRRLSLATPEATFTLALGGNEAIKLSKKNPFDLIISDLRMPYPDGEEVLSKIRRMQPETIRIILSGQATNEMVLSALPNSHQYLAKPCDSDHLIRIINSLHTVQISKLPSILKRHLLTIKGLPVDNLLINKLNEEKPCRNSFNLIKADIGLSIAILRMNMIMQDGHFRQQHACSLENFSADLEHQFINSQLIVPLNSENGLHKIIHLLGIKSRLLEHNLMKKNQTVTLPGILAYLGELVLYYCFSDELSTENLLVFRDDVTKFLWTLWGMPEEHLIILQDKKLQEIRTTLDSLFCIEEHILLSKSEILEMYREVICLTE